MAISKKDLNTARKLMTNYKRLADEYNINIPKAKLDELNEKMNNQTIRPSDLPAKIRRQIPAALENMTLEEINKLRKER
jgi:hypothetical protein